MPAVYGPLANMLGPLGAARGGSSRSSLLTNLVSYWPLHESSGTRYDSTASGNNLTSNNSVGAVVGPQPPTIPYSAEFDGSDYLSVAGNSSLNPGTGDWWTAGFFNTTTTNTQIIVSEFNDGLNSLTLEVRIVSGTLACIDSANNQPQIGTPVPINCWVFYSAWYDSANGKIWIQQNNGVPLSVNVSGGLSGATNPFSIGARNGGGAPFTGSIGPVFFGKSPPGGIASVIASINSTLYNAGAGILPSQLTSAQIAAWGLVSGWGCQDNGTSTYVDNIGTNTLTNNNGVVRTTGVAYNAASFAEANGQYLSIADNTSLDQFTNKLTTAGWVNFADISQQPILINKYQYATSGWNLQVGSSGQVYFFFGNGSAIYGVTANGVISTGNLYHIGAVYDGTQLTNATRLKIYVNGVSQSLTFSGTVPSSITTNTGPLVLGSYSFPGNPGNYMDGVMDNVGLWASALTQSQITALYGPGYPTVSTVYPFSGIA